MQIRPKFISFVALALIIPPKWALNLSPCNYPVPTMNFLMRQQCSAYFNLDILCDVDGIMSGITAERFRLAYDENSCFKNGKIGMGIVVVNDLQFPEADSLANLNDSAWSCMEAGTRARLREILLWRNLTTLYGYMDLFSEILMHRWFVKYRECKGPYFIFLIATKSAQWSSSELHRSLTYPVIRLSMDDIFTKDLGADFVAYLKEYMFYNDMSTPSRTVPIIMEKICQKFDEKEKIKISRTSIPDWAISIFILCILVSFLCLLIDVLLIRKKAFRSLVKSSDSTRTNNVDRSRRDNVQVHLLF